MRLTVEKSEGRGFQFLGAKRKGRKGPDNKANALLASERGLRRCDGSKWQAEEGVIKKCYRRPRHPCTQRNYFIYNIVEVYQPRIRVVKKKWLMTSRKNRTTGHTGTRVDTALRY